MSFFRLFIASLFFLFCGIANAGYLYRSVCYSTPEQASSAFVSDTFDTITSNGVIVRLMYEYPGATSEYYYFTDINNLQTYGSFYKTFPICESYEINDAVSLSWYVVLAWLSAWGIALLIRHVRKSSDEESGYGHS